MKFYSKKRVVLGGIVLGLIASAVIARPQPVVHAEDTRVITVHIDDAEKTIATNAKTVAEALETLQTPLGDHDKTEPELTAEVKTLSYHHRY